MKLVWHIVLKDLRRHRLAYGAWLALLVAKIVVAKLALASGSADREVFQSFSYLTTLIAAIESLIAFLIAASWVLEDGTLGSTLFWATRPISGLRLLAAKALGCFVLLVTVPIVVWLPWWGYCGLSAEQLWRAAGFCVAIQLLIIVPAITLAALTGKTVHFTRTLLLVLVGSVVWGMLGAVTNLVWRSTPSVWQGSRMDVALAALGAVSLVVLVLQFTKRRAALGWAMASTGAILALLMGRNLGWDTFRARPEISADSSSLRVELASVRPNGPPESGRRIPSGFRPLQFGFRATGLPAERRLASGRVSVALRWSDGVTFEQEVILRPSYLPRSAPRELLKLGPTTSETDEETHAWVEARIAQGRARFGGAPLTDPGVELNCWLLLPEALAQRMETEAPAFRAVVELAFKKPELVWEIPLTTGGTIGRGGVRAFIAEAKEAVKERRDRPNAAARAKVIVVQPAPLETIEFCVVQRATGAASEVVATYDLGLPLENSTGLEAASVMYHAASVRRGDTWQVVTENNAPRALVALRYLEDGSVKRVVELARVPFGAAK